MGQLVKTREDTPIMLDFVDETLDQMTFPVQMGIIVPYVLAPSARRNNRRRVSVQHPRAKMPGIVAPIGNDVLAGVPGNQGGRLGDVVTLPCSHEETQWIAQAIHTDVNLGAEASPTASQCLSGLSTVFLKLLRHKDAPAPPCCPRSRSPYPGRRRNAPTSVPKLPDHTSGQSACRHCSTCHTGVEADATVLHCGRSTTRLPRTDDSPPRAPRRHPDRCAGRKGA